MTSKPLRPIRQVTARTNDPLEVARYFDYGSPVKRARRSAVAEMPCEGCGADGEPVIRTYRPYSAGWSETRDAFYACPGCGRRLVLLPDPASSRPSDYTIDRVPDPGGLIRNAVSVVWAQAPPVRPEDVPGRVASVLEEMLSRHDGRYEVTAQTAGPPGLVVIRHPSAWLAVGFASGHTVGSAREELAVFVARTTCEAGCLIVNDLTGESVPGVEVLTGDSEIRHPS